MSRATQWEPMIVEGYETRINEDGHRETRPKWKPIIEHGQSRVGLEWRQSDQDHMVSTLHRVEQLAEAMVRRVTKECGK